TSLARKRGVLEAVRDRYAWGEWVWKAGARIRATNGVHRPTIRRRWARQRWRRRLCTRTGSRSITARRRECILRTRRPRSLPALALGHRSRQTMARRLLPSTWGRERLPIP